MSPRHTGLRIFRSCHCDTNALKLKGSGIFAYFQLTGMGVSSQSSNTRAPQLSGAFSGIIRDKGWEKKFDQHRVFPAWRDLVDHETGTFARPLKIVKDVLWIEVDNSAWMQQLQYQKHFLLESLNNFLEESTLKDIRFVVQEKPLEAARKPPPAKNAVRFVPPPEEQVEAFKAQAGCIEDESVRESLMRLWYLAQACRKDEQL